MTFQVLNQISIFGVASVGILTLLQSNHYLIRCLNRKLPRSFSSRGLDGTEVSRKLSHILSGLILAFLPFVGAQFYVPLAIGVSFILILSLSKAGRLPFLTISYLHKKRGGAIVFPISLILMSLIFFENHHVYLMSMLILALADPLAAFVGLTIGRKKLLHKTFEGSLAFTAMAFTVICGCHLFFNGHLTWSFAGSAFLISCVLAFAELVTRKGLDNLVVPVLAGALLSLL